MLACINKGDHPRLSSFVVNGKRIIENIESDITRVKKVIGKDKETCVMESTILSGGDVYVMYVLILHYYTEQEWVTAVYTSRGTLEQLLVSQTVQHAMDKEENRQLLEKMEGIIAVILQFSEYMYVL